MIKTIILSMCLAASLLSLNARAQDTLTQDALAQNDRQYTDGPVTEVDYVQVEYGHFPEYIDWLNSTWKPTMEAMKKAGLIIDYKVFQASPKSPDRSEEHTSELQSQSNLVCRLLLEKKKRPS